MLETLREIFTRKNVMFILIVIIINIIFSLVYAYAFSPDEFGFADPIDPYYFSLTTSSTVAYGDISPKTRNAKIVVMIHQFTFWIGIIALLSSFRHFKKKRKASRERQQR